MLFNFAYIYKPSRSLFFPLSRVENIYHCLVSFVDHRMEDAIGDALNGRSPSNLTSGIF